MRPSCVTRVSAFLAGAVLVACVATLASAATTAVWTWKASGTLAKVSTCSKKSEHAPGDECLYRLPDPARAIGTVKGVVVVTNTSGHRTCYGVSLSTSYMGGLQSFCVKAHAAAQYVTAGPAKHYEQTLLGLFVTSGSKTVPIQPMSDSHPTPFTITFTERA